MKINIFNKGQALGLLEWLETKIDKEALYALYWSQRKQSHKGRLPAALEHESWEKFCEDDPESATSFIQPFESTLLSFLERGDVDKESFDLVPTGSWLPRRKVTVGERFTFKEKVSAGNTKTIY